MGFIKDSKVASMTTEATKAAEAGRKVFTPKLNMPGTHHGMSGDIVDWGLMIEGIESVGWTMQQWSVSSDNKGRPEAYPLFRRA